jgi:cell wall-associated NlpC family hydrolase
MSTFIYSPTVRAIVAVTDKQGNAKTLDLTEDLVSGGLTLRTNGVHVFNFKLQNVQRKYDGIIKPMDRIVISMSRFGTPIRVMSGYMNVGPIYSVWPRVLDLSASCTLKRLQFWFWDSQSVASQNLLMSFQQAATDQTDARADGGIRDMVIKLLVEVVGWPAQKIHIGAVPDRWFDFATEVGDEIVKAADVSGLIGSMGAGAVVGGSTGLAVNGTLQAGNYGGVTLNADQAKNASIIYNVGASRNLPAQAMVIALATAMQESTLVNLNYGDRDSVGLFQQRTSQGWGSIAEIMDPVYSAGKFYDALVAVPNWQTLPVTVAAQAVQRSGFPDAYAKHEAMARAAVQALQQSAVNQGNASGLVTGSGGDAAISSSGATGRSIASVAFNLIKSKPAGHIRYQLGGDDPFNAPDPRVLDCSSLVDWVYYHAVGRPLVQSGRSTTYTLNAACVRVSAATAIATKGALLHIGQDHVEVSLGNSTTAGAHTDGVPLDQQVTVGPTNVGAWTHGNLLPGVNYADAATTPEAAAELQRVLGYATTTSAADEFGAGATPGAINPGGGGTADPFNAIINIYAWGFQPSGHGDVFAGPRAMMNDEPILPYVSNLLSASMRSWCSAPNGDFMAWFPDYFDIWGITAKMNVRSIELLDFTVNWSDQEIVTHQYVVGVPNAIDFDTATGEVGANPASNTGLNWKLTTQGIATMDFPQIFRAIFGQDASQEFVDNYLSRFGGRPNMISMPSISQGRPEFFMALYLFMQRWANQFKADIPLTFMPELWPGMILALPEFNFQAYVTEVVHTFQFGSDGFFRTDVQVCAPARTTPGAPDSRTDVFGLLPLGGKRYTTPPAAAPQQQTGRVGGRGSTPAL